MRGLFSATAIAVFGLPGVVTAEWYSGRGSGLPDKTFPIEVDGKTQQMPLYKLDLKVTELVLRRDTERADYYWLETTLAEFRDSGSGYLLILDDVVLHEIYTRGNKWAVGFESLDLARRFLEHLQKLHRLPPPQVRDATKT